MSDWLPVLRRLGITSEFAYTLAARAAANGTAFQTELIASGGVREEDLFRALALELNLAFAPSVEHGKLIVDEKNSLLLLRRRGGIGVAMAVEGEGKTRLLIAPERLNIPYMRRFVQRHPETAARICIVPPTALRQAVIARARPALQRRATDGLFDMLPDCSARLVLNAWQGAALGATAVALPVALFVAPATTTLLLHCAFSLFFLACVALRLLAARSVDTSRRPDLSALRPREMPVYTVLVALYKEAEIVPDLLVALGRIVWPRSKLEIKLVCEEDDHETIAAIEAQRLRPWIEVIKVPAGGPRTKPKALSYALPSTTGDFVVLYDAEDKPHPMQLVEAWQRFCKSGPDLACLQAPLVIANRTQSPITAMFALEYSALFRGLLPYLARKNLVLPLGGTSNHFRREMLEEVGGWDPYNVTEDADLGLRLARFGYRTETIHFPTYEDAPDNLRTWLPQRTRWFKGWAQTWLVHMRNPSSTAREVGLGSFLTTQVLFAGMLISSLSYPVMLITSAALAILFAAGKFATTSFSALLLLVDIVDVALGYGAFLRLGWLTLKRSERRGFWKLVLLTPIYWAMMSVATFRSVWQLYRRPHHWEKTPHKPHGLATRARARARGAGGAHGAYGVQQP